MLKQYAAKFYDIGKILEQVVLDQPSGEESPNIGPEYAKTLNAYLDVLVRECRSVGLELSAVAIARLKERLPTTHSDLAAAMPEIQRRISDELQTRRFLYIPAEHHNYYEGAALFGEQVATKFPKINGDIEEAGKCFATGRYTASVFHLMRVMEILVQSFGKKLGVTLTTEKVWQNILDEINKAIRAMPNAPKSAKAKQSKYAEVSGHLFTVKVAWRNPVMHPKATYTAEEAEDVFRSVKAFTIHLCSVI
jgi:hypothetical protein